MRKLLLLSSVAFLSATLICGFSIGANAQDVQGSAPDSGIETNPTLSYGGGGITVYDPGLQNLIGDAFTNLFGSVATLSEELRGDNARATDQATTVAGIGMNQQTAIATARDLNAATLARQAVDAKAQIGTAGVAEVTCSHLTLSSSTGPVHGLSYETREAEAAARASVANGEEGEITENGLRDYQRQMFEAAMQFCKPEGSGGAMADQCTGTDNEHLTVATLLFRPNLGIGYPTSNDDLAQMEYFENLLYARVHESIRPELLKDPDIDVQNLYVEADRLKAEMSIGQAAFTHLKSMRQPPSSSTRAVPFIKEMLESGDFLAPSQVTALVPENRASLKAQLEAITLGMMNPNYLQGQNVNNPALAALNISYNTSLANYLTMYQINLLEIIALAVSTDVATNRNDAVTELNEKIRQVNARQ